MFGLEDGNIVARGIIIFAALFVCRRRDRTKRYGLRRSKGIGTRGKRTEQGLVGCGARCRSRCSALSSSISLTHTFRLQRAAKDWKRYSPVSQSLRHWYGTTIPIVSLVYFLATVGTEGNMFLHGLCRQYVDGKANMGSHTDYEGMGTLKC